MTDLTLLTPKQASELTTIPLSTVYKLIDEGTLPSIRAGRSVRIRRTSLEKWIEQAEAGPQDRTMVEARSRYHRR